MIKKPTRYPPAAFTPVPVRPRADGWTSERQVAFIEALARTGNVEAACRAVEMGTSSAYDLRTRPDAASFREAWDVALDYAVHRLREAVLERAIAGTATPVFYKGEQIGERRRYDDRLAMFILRMRDPERFGSWREGRIPLEHPDGASIRLKEALTRVENAALATEYGFTEPTPPPLPAPVLLTVEQKETLDLMQAERAEKVAEEASIRALEAKREAEWAGMRGRDAEPDTEEGA